MMVSNAWSITQTANANMVGSMLPLHCFVESSDGASQEAGRAGSV